MADTTDKPQRGRAWLARATPAETARALHDGELAALLRGEATDDEPEAKPEQITREQLAGMSAEAIVQAHHDGRLADTLTGHTPEPAHHDGDGQD